MAAMYRKIIAGRKMPMPDTGKRDKIITLANALTAARILCAAVLFCVPPLSAAFRVIYALGGITDMLDGPAARHAGAVSAFGAKLDSAADLIFLIAAAVGILPALWLLLPAAVWYAAAAIGLLRLCTGAVSAIKLHRFIAAHTGLNKLSGLLLFALPFLLHWQGITWYAAGVCMICGAAAVEELILCLTGRLRS